MRKVTEKIRLAFINGESKKVENTETDGQTVWLHGNAIIKKVDKHIEFSLAGWNTPTTRERINGITGAGVYQENFECKRNGKEISAYDWHKVDECVNT